MGLGGIGMRSSRRVTVTDRGRSLARASALLFAACASHDGDPRPETIEDPHAQHRRTQPRDAGSTDGGSAQDARERGEYLVRHVALCVECHTERLASGKFDETRLLAGVRDAFDLEPEDDARGALHARNLTPDPETGLGEWSDDEIRNAFQHGMARDGRVLHSTMPYWIYHAMTNEDADAVVEFLRALPAIEHELPDRQPLSVEPQEPYHLPDGVIPHGRIDPLLPEFERAERGRYLAANAGLCVYCHTPPPADDSPLPVDLDRLFAGRRRFAPVRLATRLEEPAPQIETRNLTPHATGLLEWSPLEIANALRFGVSRNGLPVCDPMPSTYGGALLGMTEQDALDIGVYLKSIAPKDSGEIRACCSACHGPEADGGVE